MPDLTGISYGWWVGKHRRHHANPNHEDADPEIEIRALAFTTEQARAKRGIVRWTAKYQAFVFFPLLTVEALGLHVRSIQAVLRREVKAHRVENRAARRARGGLSGGVASVVAAEGGGVAWPTLSTGDRLDYLRKQCSPPATFAGAGSWISCSEV
ncbi:fatty acid desaturase [Saccharopolyspora sp. NPDC000995]